MKIKSLITVVTLVIGYMLIGGCLPLSNDVEDVDISYEFMTYEGLLQSLGTVKFNPDATHLLRLDDGEVLYVYSNFYNLWGEEYLNMKVEVGGLVIPGEDEDDKPVLAIERLEVLEVEEEEETIEINMETYTNESLGFAIGYQSDWEIEEHTSAVEFTAPQPEDSEDLVETDLIQVSTLMNKEDLELEEWVLAYQNIDTDYTKSMISPDKIEAIKVEDENSLLYYVDGGEKVYMIMHLKNQEDFELAYSNLFNEVLLSFDLLEDGAREEEVIEEEGEVVDEVVEEEIVEEVVEEEAVTETGGTSYEAIIESMDDHYWNLAEVDGEMTPIRYEFAEPDYIYVVYSLEDESMHRDLLQNLGGGEFEMLASFEEGSITDWELASGEDAAKGLELTSINAESGEAMVVLEGYRAMESATLEFEMLYPSNWYYSRSGSFFYFSTQPADASNALVTLEIKDSSVGTMKTGTSGSDFYAEIPRDDASSFYLSGSADYSEEIQVMAESI